MKQKTRALETTIRKEERMNNGTVYKYELIMSKSESLSSYRIPLYSISVELIKSDGGSTYAKSDKLFADLGIATDFFEKLIENLATPLELSYVIEDEFYKRK